jgi:hypothetical protein
MSDLLEEIKRELNCGSRNCDHPFDSSNGRVSATPRARSGVSRAKQKLRYAAF